MELQWSYNEMVARSKHSKGVTAAEPSVYRFGVWPQKIEKKGAIDCGHFNLSVTR